MKHNDLESYGMYDREVREGKRPNKPIPPIEIEKYLKTVEKQAAKDRNDFREVIRLNKELAAICHRQGKEEDAYKSEHEAFVYEQKQIYKDAGISTAAFSKTPYAERLKEAMSKEVKRALERKQIEYVVAYRKIIARICRVQGKEGDAFMLDRSNDPLLDVAEEIQIKKNISDHELVMQCLRWIAREYGNSLWDKGDE